MFVWHDGLHVLTSKSMCQVLSTVMGFLNICHEGIMVTWVIDVTIKNVIFSKESHRRAHVIINVVNIKEHQTKHCSLRDT